MTLISISLGPFWLLLLAALCFLGWRQSRLPVRWLFFVVGVYLLYCLLLRFLPVAWLAALPAPVL